jgi:hypothetical protein
VDDDVTLIDADKNGSDDGGHSRRSPEHRGVHERAPKTSVDGQTSGLELERGLLAESLAAPRAVE